MDKAIKPLRPDQRGMGIVFRGMMQREDAPLFSDGISRTEAEELRLRIRTQGVTLKILAAKVDYLMLPFWERWWFQIRRLLNVKTK